tara:strand:+ start:843 stop:1109 length:267 start_codon:yes stop_codon:yes gene_type:complete
MKIYKLVPKTVKQHEVVDEVICDKCYTPFESVSWGVHEFEFKYRNGTSYPEGGSGEEYNIDICHKCIDGLLTVLVDNGYMVRGKEWEH